MGREIRPLDRPAHDDTAAATLDTLAGNNGEVVRIDVSVSNPGMANDVELSGFRANF